MKLPKLTKGILVFSVSILSMQAKAQVTTSTISGTVSGTDGKPLSDATVHIAFENAGINKLIITQSNGTYLVPNMRVGGPYKVTVTFTGYQEKSEDNIQLDLGQNTSVDFKLEPSLVSLTDVVV